MAFFLAHGGDVRAQTTAVPQAQADITLSFAPVVKKTVPAVVNIYATAKVQQSLMLPMMEDPFFSQLFGDMTRDRLEKALGSGVIVSPDGLAVTSLHVIRGATAIRVVLSDKREFEAAIVSSDERTDLAVVRLKLNGEKLPYLELRDSDNVQVGDLVLAIGNPFGVGQTVTSGIVSALARTDVGINDLNYYIQTDADINPGNSGGALVGMDGKLLGVNAAIFSRSGGSMGIGFAIPANMVKVVLNSAESGQKTLVRPWLGMDGQEVTAEIAKSLTMPRPYGVLINKLHPLSPLAKAGAKVGDVVLTLNGKDIEDLQALRFRFATLQLGSTADMKLYRQGKELQVQVQLIKAIEDPKRETTTISGRNPLAGALIGNLSPAVADELGLSSADDRAGVVVLKIESRNSPAGTIGLRVGDIIVAINGNEIKQVSDVTLAVRRPQPVWQITVNRAGQKMSVVVQ